MGEQINSITCHASNHSPRWQVVDLLMWKIVPSRFGGGKHYIQKFKDAWVIHNKVFIQTAAVNNYLPAELLAGVCWIEVGGILTLSTEWLLMSGHLTGAARVLSINILP
ncbi:hypothetical protein [Atlantibacter hermannii]|uniref:hypothetical protein n=1 Tax=Atlantibacter hermannii TaxID=565 RepID=UPI0032EF7FB4